MARQRLTKLKRYTLHVIPHATQGEVGVNIDIIHARRRMAVHSYGVPEDAIMLMVEAVWRCAERIAPERRVIVPVPTVESAVFCLPPVMPKGLPKPAKGMTAAKFIGDVEL